MEQRRRRVLPHVPLSIVVIVMGGLHYYLLTVDPQDCPCYGWPGVNDIIFQNRWFWWWVFWGAWAIHFGEACFAMRKIFFTNEVCPEKIERVGVLYWFVLIFLLGFPSLSVLLDPKNEPQSSKKKS
jgi:hypothetical protein